MTDRPIGYYVHHHGSGHARRFAQLAATSGRRLVAFGQADDPEVPQLTVIASDRPTGPPDDRTAGGRLHWAPLDQPTMSRFVADVVAFVDRHRPIGVVVDVSVEVALLVRLCGVPVAVVRQLGDRSDDAHRLGYDVAAALLAPFPACVDDPGTAGEVRARTHHTGYLPRSNPRPIEELADVPGEDDVVVLAGRGGGGRLGAALQSLLATTTTRIHVVGAVDTVLVHPRLVAHGWVDDPRTLMVHRPVVVAAPGNNAVADVASMGAPLVAIAEPRPFDEQLHHADRLDTIGAAVHVRCPTGADWPATLAAARRRAPVLAALVEPGAAQRAREHLECTFAAVADGVGRPG